MPVEVLFVVTVKEFQIHILTQIWVFGWSSPPLLHYYYYSFHAGIIKEFFLFLGVIFLTNRFRDSH